MRLQAGVKFLQLRTAVVVPVKSKHPKQLLTAEDVTDNMVLLDNRSVFQMRTPFRCYGFNSLLSEILCNVQETQRMFRGQ